MTLFSAVAVSILMVVTACSRAGDEAIRTASDDAGPVVTTERYGREPSQFAELSIPEGSEPVPVVVLLHGGFWRSAYGLDLMRPLAADLNGHGYATWNVEYRRVGEPGGGYPATLLDVAAAIDALARVDDVDRLDLARVAVVGHSAGGHLALWAGTRDTLEPGATGSLPAVPVQLAVGQAAVVDLASAARDGLGRGAVQGFLGGDIDTVPDHFDTAQPDLARTRTRVVLVHGEDDPIVPVSQSLFAESDGVEVVVVAGADHFDVIDPGHDAWAAVVSALGSI